MMVDKTLQRKLKIQQLNFRDEQKCGESVSSSCSTSAIHRRITLVNNPLISHERWQIVTDKQNISMVICDIDIL
jgi:hypothetical protein